MPPSQTVPCSDIPAAAQVSAILITLASLLGLFALLPLGGELVNCCQARYGVCLDRRKKQVREVQSVLKGIWSIFLQLSWILDVIMVGINFGPLDVVKCNLRAYTVLIGFAAAQGSLYTSAKLMATEISNQVVNLEQFSIRSTFFIILGLMIEISALIVMTTTSGSNLIAPASQQLSTGQTIQLGDICVLGGNALPITAVVFGLNVMLALLNVVQTFPSWLAIHNAIQSEVSRLQSNLLKIKQNHQWWQLFSLSTVTTISILSHFFIVIFTYTNLVGILQNNAEITLAQNILFILNVILGVIFYYLIPYIVHRQQINPKRHAKQEESVVSTSSMVFLENELAEEQAHPFTKVFDDPLLSAHYVEFLKSDTKYKSNVFAAQFLSAILAALNEIQFTDLEEIVLFEYTKEESKGNTIELTDWYSNLLAIFDNQTVVTQKLSKMNIQPALISKFVQSLKMLKSNHVTFENLRKLLHPLVSAVYFKLEEKHLD